MIRLQLVTLCWLLPLLLFWGYSLSKLAWKNVEWPHPFPTDEVRIYTDLSLSQFSFDACSTPVDAEEAPPSAPDGDMSHWMAWRTLAGSLDASELVDLRRSWTQKYPTETKSQDEAMAYLDESVFAREWLVVALLGCLAFATRRKRRESACYALLGLLFLLLSAGPFLIRGDHIVGLAKLPYAWMYQWVPGFARFIIPARAFLGTVLCAAILAVRGTEVVAGRLCRRSQRDFSPVVSALSIALVVASFALTGYHGYSLPQTETAVPAIYSTIRGEAGRFALLDLPTGGASSRRMHYQSVHNRPVFGGLVAEEWTEQSGTDVVRTNALVLAMEMPAAVENSDAHLDAAANALSQLGFRYLVLHRDGYGRGEEHAAATSTADAVLNTPLFNNGQVSVYRLP
jgi:hypothetical protein